MSVDTDHGIWTDSLLGYKLLSSWIKSVCNTVEIKYPILWGHSSFFGTVWYYRMEFWFFLFKEYLKWMLRNRFRQKQIKSVAAHDAHIRDITSNVASPVEREKKGYLDLVIFFSPVV